MKRLLITFALAMACAVPSWAQYNCAFDFRNTSGYVTDPANGVPVLHESTSQSKTNTNGITCIYQWYNIANTPSHNPSFLSTSGYDECSTCDARIAGINQEVPSSVIQTLDNFNITVPSSGTYTVGLGFGTPSFQWCKASTGTAVCTLTFQDGIGGSTLFTVTQTGAGASGGTEVDSNNNIWTHVTWPASNTTKSVTLTSTVLSVQFSIAGVYTSAGSADLEISNITVIASGGASPSPSGKAIIF